MHQIVFIILTAISLIYFSWWISEYSKARKMWHRSKNDGVFSEIKGYDERAQYAIKRALYGLIVSAVLIMISYPVEGLFENRSTKRHINKTDVSSPTGAPQVEKDSTITVTTEINQTR